MSTPLSELDPSPPRFPQELLESTAFLLARAGFEVKSRAIAEFEQAGFSAYEYRVLALLAEGDCATQKVIASALELDRSQLVGVLDGLEERGLVERRRDQSDRRRHSVSLTAEGTRQLVRLRGVVKTLEDTYLAPLDSDTRAILHAALQRLAARDDAGC